MDDDANALLFSLVHKLPNNIAEVTHMVNENNASLALECGLMRYVPIILLENFSSALALLHKIHQCDVRVDEFFFRKETAFFFTERVYWILKNVYGRKEDSYNSKAERFNVVLDTEPFAGTKCIGNAMITEYKDNDLPKIVELFTSFIREGKNTYILDVLFDVGYFYLINCINTKEVWIFYNTIFYFKLGSLSMLTDNVAPKYLQVESKYTSIKSGRQGLLVEITRRQFDTEVVMNKRILMKYRKFVSKFKHIEHIYRKIASEVLQRSLPMCSISLNTLYSDCSTSEGGEKRPFHLLNYLGVGYLSEAKDLPGAVGYLNMLKEISNSPDKGFLFKAVYRPDVLKRFSSPEFELYGIDMLYTANELHKEIVMDCAEAIHKMNEDGVRYLMQSLEYTEHAPCTGDVCWIESSTLYKVMHILRDTLQNNKEWLFFKISYLFLMRSAAIMLSEHTCSASIHIMDILETLSQKILTNLKRNPYNFARMLFSYKKGKRTKSSNAKNIKEKHNIRKKSMDGSGDYDYFDMSVDPGEHSKENTYHGIRTELSSEDSNEKERKAKLKRIIDLKREAEKNETKDEKYFRLGLENSETEQQTQ
eukprot:jgi/Antlo1/859/1970